MQSSRRPSGVKTYGELVEELADLPVYELPARLQADSLVSTVGTPQFFMAIATLSDEAPNSAAKARLHAFASNLANTLSAIIDQATDALESASDRLTDIVVSCADDDGELRWPLAPEKAQVLATKVASKVEDGKFDEAVLTTLESWAKKAKGDEADMGGMVAILQKVLQLYAAHTCRYDEATTARLLHTQFPDCVKGAAGAVPPAYAAAAEVYKLLIAACRDMDSDASEWNTLLEAALTPQQGAAPLVAKGALLAVVQAQVERTVLLQPNGSVTQRVLAEFFAEIIKRIETIAPKDVKPPPTPGAAAAAMLGI